MNRSIFVVSSAQYHPVVARNTAMVPVDVSASRIASDGRALFVAVAMIGRASKWAQKKNVINARAMPNQHHPRNVAMRARITVDPRAV
jgi:hypothetical protein